MPRKRAVGCSAGIVRSTTCPKPSRPRKPTTPTEREWSVLSGAGSPLGRVSASDWYAARATAMARYGLGPDELRVLPSSSKEAG
jgi:hypothetical protein